MIRNLRHWVAMALKGILVLFQGVALLASAAMITNIGNQHDDGSELLLLGPYTILVPAPPGGVQTSSGYASSNPIRRICIPQPGAQPDPVSCQNAIDRIPRSTYAISLGRRGGRRLRYQNAIGYMSDDGVCSVLFGVDNPEGRDLSTSRQLSIRSELS